MADCSEIIALTYVIRRGVGRERRRACCALRHGQSVSTVMDLPSSRELELEALLRHKETQLAELTVRPLLSDVSSRTH